MRVPTLETLVDYLGQDLSWRKKEISSFRRVVGKAEFRHERAMLRGAIAILYAHWEGFVKNASTAYLAFVADRGLRYSELAPNFFGLAIRCHLDAASESSKALLFSRVCEAFTTNLAQRAKLPRRDVVDTGSNLKVDVFRNIVHLLGLPYVDFETKEKGVIEELLRLRNSVAHGEWIDVDLDKYEMLHDEVLWLLNTYRDLIETHATLGSYRRTPPAAVPPAANS